MQACVAGGRSADVSVIDIDEATLDARLVARHPVPGVAGPMARSADGRLFVVIRSEPWCVVTIDVDSESGRLRTRSIDPVADNNCFAGIDPTGDYLVVASVFGDSLHCYTIAADRSGIARSGAQRLGLSGPHGIAFDTTGRFGYVPCLSGNVVAVYLVDRGVLLPHPTQPVVRSTGSGPRQLRTHPGGEYVYLLHEHDATLHTFRIDSHAGGLRFLGAVDTVDRSSLPQIRGADLQIHPWGRLLYSTERAGSTISVFDLAGDPSRPRLLARVATETQPRGIGIDPSGRVLLAAGEISGGLSVYAIDPADGSLSYRNRIELGGSPHWVEFLTPNPRGSMAPSDESPSPSVPRGRSYVDCGPAVAGTIAPATESSQ